MSRLPRARHAAVVCGLVALVALALLASPSAVLGHVRALLASPWFPLVLLALYLARPFLAWPITVLSALCGYQYGFLVGLPLALCGAVATSLLPYYAARSLSPDWPLVGRFRDGSARFFDAAGGLRGVVAARLAPTPAEAISGAAGAARVPVGVFALGTAIGELPWTVAAVAVGVGLDSFTATAVHFDPRLAVAIAALGVALLAGPAYAVWRRR
ncbi:TVP38/TMEM64 family protein [Halarchaeum sp. CBA1220]|uniref:TVP38/TMEM64 family protein n=1 Tax=Halarchaeum sp. CBA1220 TaxID=1853682 RepID=UPI000F3A97A0|nr:VTT domain-containing protein [Halarchaeum sp. CBA1220]QLC32954.1 TVP38/TMEM64 family protein [Halarchaeum sp. CBA1220]